MVDIENRKRLAKLIQNLISGKISNDDFEDAIPESKDPAIDEICRIGVWHLYDDLYTHRLTGKHAISKKNKKEISRWVLFLNSQQEYIYPRQSYYDSLFGMMTFGLWGKRVESRFSQAGDMKYWPFESKDKFNAAA